MTVDVLDLLPEGPVDYPEAWEPSVSCMLRWPLGCARTPCCCSSTGPSTPPASGPSRTSGRRRHPGGRRRPGRQDHLARPGSAGRLPDRAPARPGGVVDYVRRLEEAIIGLFAGFGLDTGRVLRGPASGWLPTRSGRSARSPRSAYASPRHDHARLRDQRRSYLRPTRQIILRPGRGGGHLGPPTGRPVGVAEVARRCARARRPLAFAPYDQSADLGLTPELSLAG